MPRGSKNQILAGFVKRINAVEKGKTMCCWSRAKGARRCSRREEADSDVEALRNVGQNQGASAWYAYRCFVVADQQKCRCIKLVTEAGFRLVTIRDVAPMKSKPPLFSLYCASLSFTGRMTEEDPLVVAFEDGRYTPEMLAIQATRGFGPEGTNALA